MKQILHISPRQKVGALLLSLLCGYAYAQTSKATLSGYVLAQSNGEALVGAAVYDSLSGKGTYTNTYGFYSLTLPAGPVVVKTRMASFASVRKAFVLARDQRLDLTPPSLSLDAVQIVGESPSATPELGQIRLPIEQLEQVPALLGEVDVLKALALSPGVSTGVEGTSGLLVRGGSPDQNLILLDGSPVYNASHLFGFVSVFNHDAIRQIDLYKGNFPARYGGRLSSVLDIRLKEGNREERRGSANIGLLASKGLYEGPLGERSSFLLSGRASYLGLFLLPVYLSYRNGGADQYFNYWLLDLNAKVNHEFKDGSRLFFSTYGGQDFWRAQSGDPRIGASQFGLDWGNQTATLRYHRLMSDKLFFESTLAFSRYQYAIRSVEKAALDATSEVDNGFASRSRVQDWSASVQWDYYPVPAHEVRWGATGILHRFTPGQIDVFGVVDTSFGGEAIPAREWGVFIEDRIDVFPWWKLQLGARYAGFTVADTSYQAWEPRLGTRFNLPWQLQLSMAYSVMNQYLHLLSNNGVGLPNDIWVPPTDRVPPQRATQWSAGLMQNLPRWGLEWSLEGYYKRMTGLIDYRQGIDFATSISRDWQELVEVNGEGQAYGVEMLLRKPSGRLNGWIAYTFARNQRQFASINGGAAYPGRFDRRHDLSITGAYELSDRWKLSFTWQYQSGRPVTLPTALHRSPVDESQPWLQEQPIFIYQGRNQSRMPAYHRLDLGATFFPDGKEGTRSWSLGLYNAYNRRNPFFLDIERNVIRTPDREIIGADYQLTQWSLFPILPWVSYQWEF